MGYEVKKDWPKKAITWQIGRTKYFTIPFTWELPRVRQMLIQRTMDYDNAIVGGPAIELIPEYFADIPNVAIGQSYPGILQMLNPLATRTTTGCIRPCRFCGIGQGLIEPGGFRELIDWPDLPLITDNNLLAASQGHFDKVIDRLIPWGWADFNQGLDARLLTQYHADRFAGIQNPTIRLALDHKRDQGKWMIAYEKLRQAGIRNGDIRSYALIGFNSDPGEAWERCEWVNGLNITVLPMWYHSLDQLQKNIVTADQAALGWNDFERRRIMGWFYRHRVAVK